MQENRNSKSLGYLSIIPLDVILAFFPYLNLQDKKSCRLVNRLLCDIMDSRYLTMTLRYTHDPNTCIKDLKPNIEHLIDSHPKATGIVLERLPLHGGNEYYDFPPRIVKMTFVCNPMPSMTWPHHVTELKFDIPRKSHIRWTHFFDDLKPDLFANIQVLHFGSIRFNHAIDLSQASQIRDLQVSIMSEHVMPTLESLPNPEKLEKLSIFGRNRWNEYSVLKFPNLSDLTLRNYFPKLCLENLRTLRIYSKYPENIPMRTKSSLRKLEKLENLVIHVGSANEIEKYFPKNLLNLDLRFDKESSETVVINLPHLSHLRLSRVPIYHFGLLPSLTVLHVYHELIPILKTAINVTEIVILDEVCDGWGVVDVSDSVKILRLHAWPSIERLPRRTDLQLVYAGRWPSHLSRESLPPNLRFASH